MQQTAFPIVAIVPSGCNPKRKLAWGIQAEKKTFAEAYRWKRKLSRVREKYATLITYITYGKYMICE